MRSACYPAAKSIPCQLWAFRARREARAKALDRTEQERHAQRLRQALDLVVQEAAQVAGGSLSDRIIARGSLGGLGGQVFVAEPPCPLVAGGPGGVQGDAVEPGPDRAALAGGGRVAGQRQERRLEGIFRVMGVAELTAAQSPDHRSVPPQQQLERGRIPIAGEATDQFGIGHLGDVGTGCPRRPGQEGRKRTAHEGLQPRGSTTY